MKLVIDIPDEYVEQIKNNTEGATAESEAVDAIRNGIPYENQPQGDLISREALKEAIRKRLGISLLKYLTEQEKVIVEEIDNAPTVAPNWRFYYDHGYAQAKRDLKKEIENLVAGGAEGLKNYYKNGSKSDENSWIGGVYDAWEVIDEATPVSDRYDEGYAQGYIDGSTGADWKGEDE